MSTKYKSSIRRECTWVSKRNLKLFIAVGGLQLFALVCNLAQSIHNETEETNGLTRKWWKGIDGTAQWKKQGIAAKSKLKIVSVYDFNKSVCRLYGRVRGLHCGACACVCVLSATSSSLISIGAFVYCSVIVLCSVSVHRHQKAYSL